MNAATSNQSKKMSSAKFSEYVMGMDDLFKMAARNGYYLPKQKSQAINEIALFNILQGKYWCPKVDEIRIKNCVPANQRCHLGNPATQMPREEAEPRLDRRCAHAGQDVDGRRACHPRPL